MRLLFAINLIVSLVIVGLVLYFAGFNDVVGSLSSVNFYYIFLGIIAILVMDVIMSYRIHIILKEAGAPLEFFKIMKAHFVGMLLSDFTPSRAGYFAAAAVMHYKYDVPSEKALLSIFGPQIFDFATKLIAGGAAVLYILFVFIGPDKGWILILSTVIISIIIITMLLLLFSAKFLSYFSFFSKIPIASKIINLISKMQKSSKVIVKKTPHIIVLLLSSWIARAVSWHCVAKSIGIEVQTPFPEFFFYLFLQPLITMLEFVPSPTIAGLGLSEGGSTLVFSLFGILPAKATLFALLARFKTTLLHIVSVPEALEAAKKVKLD